MKKNLIKKQVWLWLNPTQLHPCHNLGLQWLRWLKELIIVSSESTLLNCLITPCDQLLLMFILFLNGIMLQMACASWIVAAYGRATSSSASWFYIKLRLFRDFLVTGLRDRQYKLLTMSWPAHFFRFHRGEEAHL